MSIDASFRRSILPEQDRGSVIPDSQKKKAENPQLVMEPGVVRPVFKFADGLGLTDSYGNVYEGYGSGGDTITWRHIPAESIDSEIDETAEDLDVIQYDDETQKFKTKSYTQAQLMRLFNDPVPSDKDLVWYDSANQYWKPASFDTIKNQFKIVSTGELTVSEDDILIADASGNFVPLPVDEVVDEIIDEYLEERVVVDLYSGEIRNPENRTYILVQNLPFPIGITDTYQDADGTAEIAFPSGTLSAGGQLSITVSDVGESDEYLRFQINFQRFI